MSLGLDRIRYLREFVERNKGHANQSVGGPMVFSTHDTIELLAAAEALARLEAWTRHGMAEIDPEYGVGWRVGLYRDSGSTACAPSAPDLLTAITRALDEAEGRS